MGWIQVASMSAREGKRRLKNQMMLIKHYIRIILQATKPVEVVWLACKATNTSLLYFLLIAYTHTLTHTHSLTHTHTHTHAQGQNKQQQQQPPPANPPPANPPPPPPPATSSPSPPPDPANGPKKDYSDLPPHSAVYPAHAVSKCFP